jgi:hypothetical protein
MELCSISVSSHAYFVVITFKILSLGNFQYALFITTYALMYLRSSGHIHLAELKLCAL